MFKKKVEKKSKFHTCSKCKTQTPLFSCPNCKATAIKTDLDCRLNDEPKYTTVIKFDNPVGNLSAAEKRKLRRLKRKAKV